MITHKFAIKTKLPTKALSEILNLFLTQNVLTCPSALARFQADPIELLNNLESVPLKSFVLSDQACLELSKIHVALEWSLWEVVAAMVDYIEYSNDTSLILWKWRHRKLF